MSRSAPPPSNFSSGFTYGGLTNPNAQPSGQPPVVGGIFGGAGSPPQRQYIPNPFAAQTPPSGPLPPGMNAGPPNGMTPEQWHQYSYMTGKERKQSEVMRRLVGVLRARNQPRPQTTGQPTAVAPNSGGGSAMANALRNMRQV